MQKSFLLFCQNKILCRNDTRGVLPLDQQEWDEIGAVNTSITIDFPTDKSSCIVELNEGTTLSRQYKWVSLRGQVGHISDRLFKQWSRASQLLHWHKTHIFCGSCGTKTEPHHTEIARICPDCNSCFYPAIAPCIIVLVSRGKEVLLARSPRFPEAMFSTLAGFIEPGESAEDAIAREIQEEVNIEVKNIRYFDSQPWPFPGQLMLGFFADHASGEIEIDGEEICEAHWYLSDELPKIPGPGTIAGRLIRHHLNSMQLHL